MDWWTDPLPDLATHLHGLGVGGQQDLRPLTTGSALFQARVAWESAQRQDQLVDRLVKQTHGLVIATWAVAAVGIGSILLAFLGS